MQECVFSENSEEDGKYQEQQIQLHEKLEEQERKSGKKTLSRLFLGSVSIQGLKKRAQVSLLSLSEDPGSV